MRIVLMILKYLSVFLTVCASVFPTIAPKNEPYEAKYYRLGIPLEEYYPEGIPGRTAWDVEVYEDKLFVASGDYDKNIGPVHIFYYDLNEKSWIESGTVSDEQIEQFYFIDGKLISPGCDPKQDWNWGNLYIYENDQWITKRTIPGGIHGFDMIKFDGQLFVAAGVLPGQLPVFVSNDGGDTFREVPMFKDDQPYSTAIDPEITVKSALVRCYDFFICNSELYAFCYRNINDDYQMMIFRYQDGGFYYHSDLPRSLSYSRSSFEIFRTKVQYENKAWFSTGKLYVSQDMISAEEITLEENSIVTDLRIIEGRLYVMTVTPKENGEYITSVWVKKLLAKNEFQKLFYFTYPSPAQSFTYYKEHFYFGMGDGTLSESEPTNGEVLSVKHPI